MTAPHSRTGVELESAANLDYASYAAFQREAFRDLLDRSGASDVHMTPEFYRWKYNPPAGPAHLASIIEGDRRLSSSAMLPLFISVGGENGIGWHFLDVATLPEERRKGHLLATLQRLIEAVPPGDLMFAFPNSGSIGAFLKLGFRESGVVTTWVNPWVVPIARTDPKIGRIERFLPEHGDAGRTAAIGAPQVVRNREYLDWRYVEHPVADYVRFGIEVRDGSGVCVVRRARALGRELALVMDVFGSSSRARSALLAHAAGWARSEKMGMMVLMNSGMTLSTAVRTMLAPVPSFLLPKRQALVVAGPENRLGAVREKWFLQTGDWDAF